VLVEEKVRIVEEQCLAGLVVVLPESDRTTLSRSALFLLLVDLLGFLSSFLALSIPRLFRHKKPSFTGCIALVYHRYSFFVK
jgi:hypothetical protein